MVGIYLGWVPQLGGHNPTPAIFSHVQVRGKFKKQWVVGGSNQISVMLIGRMGLSVLHATNYTTLTLCVDIRRLSVMVESGTVKFGQSEKREN